MKNNILTIKQYFLTKKRCEHCFTKKYVLTKNAVRIEYALSSSNKSSSELITKILISLRPDLSQSRPIIEAKSETVSTSKNVHRTIVLADAEADSPAM